MRHQRFIVAAIAVSSLLLTSATTKTPQFTYTVGGCGQVLPQAAPRARLPNFTLEIQDQGVSLSHQLHYTCCAEFRLNSQIRDREIIITEINEGGICRCMCDYTVNAIVAPLTPGHYTLKVYGIQDSQLESDLQLLFEERVEIE
jgi:hypothetical protein